MPSELLEDFLGPPIRPDPRTSRVRCAKRCSTRAALSALSLRGLREGLFKFELQLSQSTNRMVCAIISLLSYHTHHNFSRHTHPNFAPITYS